MTESKPLKNPPYLKKWILSPPKVRNKILKPQHPHLGGWRKRFARTADLGAEADLGLGVGAVAADRGAVQLIAGRHGGHVLGVGPQRGEHGAGRGHLLGVGHQRRVRGLPQPHLRTQSDVTTVAVSICGGSVSSSYKLTR